MHPQFLTPNSLVCNIQDLAYHLSVSTVTVQTLGSDIRLNLFQQWLVV